ncbi:hypothetical protein M23134_04728 [Microscilla marina ATCC 23134]|uniref:Uncharacterized protein n=1 Tax=Microscilla marina ATCC 23134 TaxID=313606 RepID=A1ZRF0_MICM2|nr:hypothetical protein M23134_04728 [Microscilla marina ATCC 23134]
MLYTTKLSGFSHHQYTISYQPLATPSIVVSRQKQMEGVKGRCEHILIEKTLKQ